MEGHIQQQPPPSLAVSPASIPMVTGASTIIYGVGERELEGLIQLSLLPLKEIEAEEGCLICHLRQERQSIVREKVDNFPFLMNGEIGARGLIPERDQIDEYETEWRERLIKGKGEECNTTSVPNNYRNGEDVSIREGK